MRTVLLLLFILALPFVSRSQNISSEQAMRVAGNFYSERSVLAKDMDFCFIGIKSVRAVGSTKPAYYICEIQPKGFVVVSATNNVLPILAYSFESGYETETPLHEGFITWMNHYQQQIEYAIQNNIVATEDIKLEWERLLNVGFQANSDLKQLQVVEPLLVSKWNQDYPYNNWCPTDLSGPGNHCYAGCVATAMGQLLNYYRFPEQGQGNYTYTHPVYGTISADFGASTYNWSGMPSFLSKENDAIGELLFHQGVSVDMDYGPDGSGMWNHKAAYSLKTYFRYGPETRYFFRDSVSIDWDSLLVTNLDLRKPLYYAGWAGVQSTSGHAFVCDGYQPGNYYHFSWGWGGSQDGYFYTDNLTPSGSNFNFAQEVIPLFPDTIQNNYPNYCTGNSIITSLRGSIEDGSGWYNYQNNSDCSWLISPQDVEYDSIKNIKITFLRFDTEAGADTLYVFDGSDASAPLIGAYTGNGLPGGITSTGNKVFIKFHSNSSVSKSGWLLDFESIIPVYCSGITTLNSPSGSIEDGSSNKNYNSNSMCRWKITPTGGMPLSFQFTTFDTYDSTDIVKIIDLQSQEILGVFSGNQLPPTVTSQSGKMLILFTTNSEGNAQGWSGNYTTSGVGISELDSCEYQTLVYPNPTTGQITLQEYFREGSEITIRIVDNKGSTIFIRKFITHAGENTIPLNLDMLDSATYSMYIDGNKQNKVLKIIIKH
ncbi:MAG: C10 family peptidase [Bacteroidales bacterium]